MSKTLLIIGSILLLIIILLILILCFNLLFRPALQPFKVTDILKSEDNVVIYMTYDDNYDKIGQLASKKNRKYASEMGYDFKVFKKGWPTDIKPHWARYYMARKLMNNPHYRYLMYIDTDAMFMKKLRIPKPAQNQIIVGNEFGLRGGRSLMGNMSPINSGILIIPNNSLTRQFLDKFLHKKSNKNAPNWEQVCAKRKYKKGLFFYDQDCWDAILRENAQAPLEIKFLDLQANRLPTDAFILHAAGMNNDKRIKLLQEGLRQT